MFCWRCDQVAVFSKNVRFIAKIWRFDFAACCQDEGFSKEKRILLFYSLCKRTRIYVLCVKTFFFFYFFQIQKNIRISFNENDYQSIFFAVLLLTCPLNCQSPCQISFDQLFLACGSRGPVRWHLMSFLSLTSHEESVLSKVDWKLWPALKPIRFNSIRNQ